MSGCSIEEISLSDVDNRGGGGESDGDDDDSEIGGKSEEGLRRRRGRRMVSDFGKVVVHQFSKAKKQIRRIKSKKSLAPKSSRSENEGNVNIGGSGGRYRGSGCKFCFSRPKVLESPDESPMSDPNAPNFTYLMLKNLMDKNDFYSKECNPHLD